MEAWNALRVNGQRAVKVIYINGMGISAKAKQMNLYDTPDCYARRSFWLSNSPKYMFIHYLDISRSYQQKVQFKRKTNTLELKAITPEIVIPRDLKAEKLE